MKATFVQAAGILLLMSTTSFSATLPKEPEIDILETIDYPFMYNQECLGAGVGVIPVGCMEETPMQRCRYPDSVTEELQLYPICPLTENEINLDEEEIEDNSTDERLKRAKRRIGKKYKQIWKRVTKQVGKDLKKIYVPVKIFCSQYDCTGCVGNPTNFWCPIVLPILVLL